MLFKILDFPCSEGFMVLLLFTTIEWKTFFSQRTSQQKQTNEQNCLWEKTPDIVLLGAWWWLLSFWPAHVLCSLPFSTRASLPPPQGTPRHPSGFRGYPSSREGVCSPAVPAAGGQRPPTTSAEGSLFCLAFFHQNAQPLSQHSGFLTQPALSLFPVGLGR